MSALDNEISCKAPPMLFNLETYRSACHSHTPLTCPTMVSQQGPRGISAGGMVMAKPVLLSDSVPL